MKTYIITIIGATILSSIGIMLTPEAMRKYVSIITGFIIISAIVKPLSALTNVDIFSGLNGEYVATQDYDRIYTNAVATTLENEISQDISTRIKNEFAEDVKAIAELETKDNEITKITKITLDKMTDYKIIQRLMEVYNVDEVVVDGKRYIKKNNQKQE